MDRERVIHKWCAGVDEDGQLPEIEFESDDSADSQELPEQQ